MFFLGINLHVRVFKETAEQILKILVSGQSYGYTRGNYAIWDHPEPLGGRPQPFEIAKSAAICGRKLHCSRRYSAKHLMGRPIVSCGDHG